MVDSSVSRSSDTTRTLTPALLGIMGLALCGFSAFFLSYATLVLHGQRMGLTTVTAGTVLSIMMVMVVIVQPVTPWFTRRFGPRCTFGLALGLEALGTLLSGVAAYPFAMLLTGSLILGAGFGILVVVSTAVVPASVPPQRLGRALGFFGATTASATAISAPLGLWLSSLVSTQQFRWISVAVLIAAVPVLAAVPARRTVARGTVHTGQVTATPSALRTVGLAVVLLPTVLILTGYGLVLAFGPPDGGIHPAWFLLSMQLFVIAGRFVASALLDRFPAVAIMLWGLGLALVGLFLAAGLTGPAILGGIVLFGLGTGGVQAASLFLAFQQAGSSNRGSVAWNMTFDIGLGFAGLVGGLGFTFLGASVTYLLCALALLPCTALFAWYFRRSRRAD